MLGDVVLLIASAAELIEWNLVLLGTGEDPLNQKPTQYPDSATNIKSRRNKVDSPSSSWFTKFRNSVAKTGIILPDLESQPSNNKPKANIYTPPVYKPNRKPTFEYIKPRPIPFRHGDHNHSLLLGGVNFNGLNNLRGSLQSTSSTDTGTADTFLLSFAVVGCCGKVSIFSVV